MSMKRFVQTKATEVTPKRQRKMPTTAQKGGLPDILKEGKNYAAVGHHCGINECLVRYLKEENHIRTTEAISFCKDERGLYLSATKPS